MPGRLTEERAVAAAIVAAALAFILGSFAMPIGTLLAPGPGLVPLFLGSATLVAMIASLFAAERTEPNADGETIAEDTDPAQTSQPSLPRVPLILAVLTLCLLGFERIGYVPAVFASSLVCLYFLERRSLLLSLLISAILSAGLFWLFERVLYVTLPRGLLEFWQ